MEDYKPSFSEAQFGKLRQEAQKRLKAQSDAGLESTQWETDTLKMLEELNIRQVELEIQNHELIAARKELEEAINSYTDLYDFAPVAYLTLDVKGVIQDVNQTGISLLKTDRSLLIGSPFLVQVKPDHHPSYFNFLRDILDKDARQQCDLELANAHQSIWVHMEGTCVSLAGKVKERQIRLAVMDITSRRQAEAGSLQAQKMESIGTLAGGIAHDFNNLLAIIQGNTSIMLMEIGTKAHPFYEGLKEIEACVDKAAILTRQLLNYARGGKYEVRPTNINELVRSTADIFGRTRREIALHLFHEPAIWMVLADATQIEQVLMNLFVNASLAMPEGGDLTVQTQNTVLDEATARGLSLNPGKYARISVTDTGCGMDEAVCKRVFEPFFTTRETGKGTGMGLASSYGIIKNHLGRIDVASRKGKGSTFTIYLPATGAINLEPDAVRSQPDAPPKGGGVILLVDDEIMLTKVGSIMLTTHGHTVLTANSGKEALEIYRNHTNIDLVILDMIMPGMGGAELYDRLKAENPNIRVLLSSGYSLDGPAQQIMEKGCNGFIQKPYRLKEIGRKVAEILNQCP